MKQKLVAAFLAAIVVGGLGYWLASADHRLDRNVPGATTTAGKSSASD